MNFYMIQYLYSCTRIVFIKNNIFQWKNLRVVKKENFIMEDTL